MKKNTLLLTVIIGLGCFFSVANAQEQPFSQEAIMSYVSNIIVNIDNSIDVTETITYETGPQEHHGIYRDIYPYSSQGRKMSIEKVTVIDEKGDPYLFNVSDSGKNVRIQIGDPNQTFNGQKVYVIGYHATRAIAQLKDIDEIYWNVTGNKWNMPIYEARASVVLPSGVPVSQSACYYGLKGSTQQCKTAIDASGTDIFNASSSLGLHEGLTIATGFKKGVVNPYSSSDAVSNFFDTYWRWLVSAILPIVTFIVTFFFWYTRGRDPRGTGIIIPQYDVPDELTPMEVGGIIYEKVSADYISAEIIYLATKGYLKIRQTEERFLGIIKTTDYELIKLKDFSDLKNDFDQDLLKGLFGTQSELPVSELRKVFFQQRAPSPLPEPMPLASSVSLSSLTYTFYKDARLVVESVLSSLVKKGYYKNLGRMESGIMRIPMMVVLFMLVWFPLFVGGFLGIIFFNGNPFPLIVGIFVSALIYLTISHFSPAKTKKGVMSREYILGLKDYLQIAEKDRIQFHNAPEKKPEVFEKLLPYAMVLGVADIWSKEFEGIYTTPPSWYSGPASDTFSATSFSQTISSFSAFASSSSSSGSGGGGSSGGGGGGGGGGSW